MLDVRDHVRAALIAATLLVHGIAASPLPKSVKRANFDSEMATEEFDRWVGILRGVGIRTTRKALADDAYASGVVLADLRGFLLGPFRPWFRISGTGQAWGLFTYPDSFPHQLVIEVREQGAWRAVFKALDPDAHWQRELLAYRRVRGVYDGNTQKPGPSYTHFVTWIGHRALEDFPTADAARVGFLRFHTRAPGEPADPSVEAKFQRVVER